MKLDHCCFCGAKERLHHILLGKKEQDHEVMTLCKHHHDLHHKHYGDRLEYFKTDMAAQDIGNLAFWASVKTGRDEEINTIFDEFGVASIGEMTVAERIEYVGELFEIMEKKG